MSELFDLAVAFASQPVPGEGRVAIVTNSGGPGIMATDAVESKHLQMARFKKETITALHGHLPAEANIYNPVDVLGDAGPDRYRFALASVLADENVDSVVVLVCPTAVTRPLETARAMIEMHQVQPDKPMLAAFMGGAKLAEGTRLLTQSGVPCFTFPEPAITSISGLVDYARLRTRPASPEIFHFNDVDRKTVQSIFTRVKKDNRLVLLGSEAAKVAAAYGIHAAHTVLATQPEEAAAKAETIGYPVVLKVASPKILHKTDLGGVKMGLDTPDKVIAGFIEIMENVHRYMPQAAVYGIEVQKMMPKGIELIIGMSRDVQFGPLIAFGLGGIYVNLIKDVSFRLAHRLTKQEIKDMIAETKAFTLLRGYRGEKPADINAIVEVIGRVASLATDFPEMAEMDINPLFAYNSGVCALDLKITIE